MKESSFATINTRANSVHCLSGDNNAIVLKTMIQLQEAERV